MTGTAIDTLTVDTTALNAWRADEYYNYARELVQADSDLSDRAASWFSQLIRSVFHNDFYQINGRWIWFVLGIACIGLLIYFFWRIIPRQFGRNQRSAIVYSVEEDSIYGSALFGHFGANPSSDGAKSLSRGRATYLFTDVEDAQRRRTD